MIHIGCSGWSYPEWVGPFYRTNDKLFLQYSEHFSCVEINSSFYSFPSRQAVKIWVKESSTRKGFRFSIKMPGRITHELLVQDNQTAIKEALRFEQEVLNVLKNANILIGCLIQLPPFIGRREWPKVISLTEKMERESLNYFVETRNKTLEIPEVEESLVNLNMGRVLLDSPDHEISKESAAGSSIYVRLHGRNAAEWKSGGTGMSKYDYSYNENELKDISLTLSKLSLSHDDIFVFFNNHPHGNAPLNAMKLKEMMGIPDAQEKIQKRLFF